VGIEDLKEAGYVFRQRIYQATGGGVAVPAATSQDEVITLLIPLLKGQAMRLRYWGSLSTSAGDAFKLVVPVITIFLAGPAGSVIHANSRPSGLFPTGAASVAAGWLSQTFYALADEFEVTDEDLQSPLGSGVGNWTLSLNAGVSNTDGVGAHTPVLSLQCLTEYYNRKKL
jgi:hypothetical protein